jgi:signal transduction histidine kinase
MISTISSRPFSVTAISARRVENDGRNRRTSARSPGGLTRLGLDRSTSRVQPQASACSIHRGREFAPDRLERSLLRLLGENISVNATSSGQDGLHTKVDPGQLTQIILNLVVNARDAMPRGGCLAMETAAVTIDAVGDREPTTDEIPAGNYVRVSVTDNGSGMTDEVKQHLFEPFFTAKDEGHGSGLGGDELRNCSPKRRPIRVESELGKGTTVSFPTDSSAPARFQHETGSE